MDDNEIAKLVREAIREELVPSSDKLKAEFADRFSAIVGTGQMDALRELQAEYIEKGLTQEDVDVNKKGKAPLPGEWRR